TFQKRIGTSVAKKPETPKPMTSSLRNMERSAIVKVAASAHPAFDRSRTLQPPRSTVGTDGFRSGPEPPLIKRDRALTTNLPRSQSPPAPLKRTIMIAPPTNSL